MITNLRNKLFSERYAVSVSEDTVTVDRLEKDGNCWKWPSHLSRQPIQLLDFQTLSQIIMAEYKKNENLTIHMASKLPANEVLYWLEANQASFPNLWVQERKAKAKKISSFFAWRKEKAERFIEYVTTGRTFSLPLKGKLPNGEVFYLDDWKKSDKAQLSDSIDKMYTHLEKCKDSEDVVERSYRMFYLFEGRGSKASSAQLAQRFISKAQNEAIQNPRDTYRLAIRDKEGKAVGGITVDMLARPDAPLAAQGDIGYFVDPDHAADKYVSSALNLLLPFYFKNHAVLCLDIVSSSDSSESLNADSNNLLSQRVATHLGAYQTNERPLAGFEAYTPWCLTKEAFLDNRWLRVLTVINQPQKTPIETQAKAPQRITTQKIQNTRVIGIGE